MKKPKISPGKWELRESNENPWRIGVVGSRGIMIAETKTGHDARAISAVPEMINALIKAKELLDHVPDTDFEQEAINKALIKAGVKGVRMEEKV